MVAWFMKQPGFELFAAPYSEETLEEAKQYCRDNNLTPETVKLQRTLDKNGNYDLVLVKVI